MKNLRGIVYKLCIFIFFLPFNTIAQNSFESWKDYSIYTVAFEISEKEAREMLTAQPSADDFTKMLHTPVATFQKEWNDAPEKGHFIYADIEKNKVHLRYNPIIPFQVFLFKEYGKLTIQVIDKEGTVRDNANVSIKGRWKLMDQSLVYDRVSKTYSIEEDSEKEERLLTVKLDGFTMFFDLNKKVIRPYLYNGDSNNDISRPAFYSYMITDKNKYKPGENVRFKTYALAQNKKALTKKLGVWIQTSSDHDSFKKICDIEPYNEGGYAGEINLHDSLQLRLDERYQIQLREKGGRIVSNTSFSYEDYDLFKNERLEVVVAPNHYYPKMNEVKIRIIDDNGLAVLGAKANVSVTLYPIQKSFKPLLVLSKNRIIVQDLELKGNGEFTSVEIPSDLFDAADLSYTIYVDVNTPEGKKISRQQKVNYHYSEELIERSLVNDSIRLEYFVNGESQAVKAELKYLDNHHNRIIDLPFQDAFWQYEPAYEVTILQNGYSKKFMPSDLPMQIDVLGEIRSDLFEVELVNPLNLDLTWYIYQGPKLLEKGNGTGMKFEMEYPETNYTHYVEIFYVMGGEEKVFRKGFVPQQEMLHLDMNMPDRVYPGQIMDAKITVTDNWNKPVNNVDLTAFATSSLLGYEVPDLPYYGSLPSGREERSSYSIYRKEYVRDLNLDYDFWHQLSHLNEQPYYEFIYPKNKISTVTIPVLGENTQFAPYVFNWGERVNIQVIEVDGEPVYFDWTHQVRAYSFSVDPTIEHQIVLRLPDRILTLDHVRFEEGMKTLLSLDMHALPSTVDVKLLSDWEKGDMYKIYYDKYQKYVSAFILSKYNQYFYEEDILTVGKNSYVLNNRKKNSYSFTNKIIVGPITADSASFKTHSFFHLPGHTYDLSISRPGIVEAKSFSITDLSFDYDFQPINMNELKQTEGTFFIPEGTNSILLSELDVNDYKHNLRILFPEDSVSHIMDVFFRDRETNMITKLYVQSNNDRYSPKDRYYLSNDLEGVYDVFVYCNDGYLKQDSVPFGREFYTFLDMRQLPKLKKDPVWNFWSENRNSYWRWNLPTKMIPVNTKTIQIRKGTGIALKGNVTDEYGEPLIGLAVMVKGTTIGTITDIDGNFSLELDPGEHDIEFRYIGYTSKVVKLKGGTSVNIVMEEEAMLLDEIIVVGYGVRRRASISGAISKISYGSNDSETSNTTMPREEVEDSEAETVDDDAEERLYRELMQLDGLRSNFSDVGFWQPSLVTNKKGEAQFQITFPDDITRWDAVVYAMNKKLKTGTFRKSIRSYKPLMAELQTPHFIVEGDSSHFSGMIRNYTKDKGITGLLSIGQDGHTLFEEQINLDEYRMDYPLMVAEVTDSLTASYHFTRSDGYNDGEKRVIPVNKKGILISDGREELIGKGERLTVTAGDDEEVELRVLANTIDVFMQSVNYLMGYEHACNEQLSSRLIGILNYKIYQNYTGEPFEEDKAVNLIMTRLKNHQNNKGLWSWWNREDEIAHWMSAQVIRAFAMANNEGYKVDINLKRIIEYYFEGEDSPASLSEKIDILQAVSEWGQNKKLLEIASKIETENKFLNRVKQLQLWEVIAKNGGTIDVDKLNGMMEAEDGKGIFVYGVDGNWRESDLIATLGAYRVARYIPSLQKEKEAIIYSILVNRNKRWNTYESARVVSTVLKDLTLDKQKEAQITLTYRGGKKINLTDKHYMSILQPGESVVIENQSPFPVISSMTNNKKLRRLNTHSSGALFISSNLNNGSVLNVDQPVTVTVQVSVVSDHVRYAVIEVPIPAGCIYEPKARNHKSRYNEVHREYFKDKVAIYCDYLDSGSHTFYIELLPKYPGTYTMNPAKVELMYEPAVNANSDLKTIRIKAAE